MLEIIYVFTRRREDLLNVSYCKTLDCLRLFLSLQNGFVNSNKSFIYKRGPEFYDLFLWSSSSLFMRLISWFNSFPTFPKIKCFVFRCYINGCFVIYKLLMCIPIYHWLHLWSTFDYFFLMVTVFVNNRYHYFWYPFQKYDFRTTKIF